MRFERIKKLCREACQLLPNSNHHSSPATQERAWLRSAALLLGDPIGGGEHRNHRPGAGDKLDIKDLLTGFTPAQASSFIGLTTVGSDTVVSVDGNGSVGGASYSAIATLQGVTGLLLNDLLAYNLIVS